MISPGCMQWAAQMGEFPDIMQAPPWLLTILGGFGATWITLSLIVQKTRAMQRADKIADARTEADVRLLEAETEIKLRRLEEESKRRDQS